MILGASSNSWMPSFIDTCSASYLNFQRNLKRKNCRKIFSDCKKVVQLRDKSLKHGNK